MPQGIGITEIGEYRFIDMNTNVNISMTAGWNES